jgi:hypothetical protein
MRKITIETLITKSITRTKIILFKPFSIKKWLCLLLIAYLAGSLGGGSFNFNGFNNRCSKKAEAAGEEQSSASFQEQANIGEADSDNSDAQTSNTKGFCPLMTSMSYWLLGILVIFILSIIILFAWLGARFKFVWFNAMVSNDVSIKEPFGRFKTEGDSLFKFSLLFLVAVIVFFALIGFWAYLNGTSQGIFVSKPDWSFAKVMNVFALPLITLIAGIIFMAILGVCLDHFVVTIMGMERCTFWPAWGKFVAVAGSNKKDLLIYFLVLIALGIIAAILAFLVAFICFAVVLIAAAILFGIPFLLIVMLFKAKIMFITFAIIAGIPFAAVTILFFMCVGLPFAVFFKTFSLYFISSLECGYQPLPLDDAVQLS